MAGSVPRQPHLRIVVMGVAGSGKTTVGIRLAEQLGTRFVDADDLHPPANIAKMTAGQALTDDDRAPWLRRIREELAVGGDVVVTCSALKRRYRDVLRAAGGTLFVFLEVGEEIAHQRAARRAGHFMGAGMVAGQFAALESPAPDETDVLIVDANGDVESVVQAAAAALNGPEPWRDVPAERDDR